MRVALGRPQPVDAGIDDALAEQALLVANTGSQSLGTLTRQILHLQDAVAALLVEVLEGAVVIEGLSRLSVSFGHLIGALGTARLQTANLEASRNRLTGLLAKEVFYADVARACATALERGHRAFVVALDLDGLKAINDTQGHDAGDAAIRQLAGTLSESVGSRGTAYHLSGDEFALIVRGDDELAVEEILSATVELGAPAFSAGWLLLDDEIAERDPEDVYHEADIRMLDAKRSKRAHRA